MARSRSRSFPISRFAFTLTDLIVVVVIIGIAAAVIVPYVANTDDLQAMSSARMIVSDLQYAQDTSVTTQSPVTVTFHTNNETYELSNASVRLTHPINKTSYLVNFRAVSGLGNVDIASANFGGVATVTFDVMGAPGPVAPTGGETHNIVLRAGTKVFYVDVATATGKVTVTGG